MSENLYPHNDNPNFKKTTKEASYNDMVQNPIKYEAIGLMYGGMLFFGIGFGALITYLVWGYIFPEAIVGAILGGVLGLGLGMVCNAIILLKNK